MFGFEKVEIVLQPDGLYNVYVTKSFAPKYGGGKQTFVENGGRSPHTALDVARSMVTVSAARRTDVHDNYQPTNYFDGSSGKVVKTL